MTEVEINCNKITDEAKFFKKLDTPFDVIFRINKKVFIRTSKNSIETHTRNINKIISILAYLQINCTIHEHHSFKMRQRINEAALKAFMKD